MVLLSCILVTSVIFLLLSQQKTHNRSYPGKNMIISRTVILKKPDIRTKNNCTKGIVMVGAAKNLVLSREVT